MYVEVILNGDMNYEKYNEQKANYRDILTRIVDICANQFPRLIIKVMSNLPELIANTGHY